MQKIESLVFISYTSVDRGRVEPIVNDLIAVGVDAWMDTKRIMAGQNWDFEIRRALEKAAIIIVFISNNSVSKRGYVQRELRLALEKADEKLIDDIYLIPVLLDDDVVIPDVIKDVQFVRASDEEFHDKLLAAVKYQLERLGHAIEAVQKEAEIKWKFNNYHESRDGVPGFEADLRIPIMTSDIHPSINQVGDIIKGVMFDYLLDLRYQTLLPDHELYNFGQDRFARTHTLDIQPQTPKIRGRILSMLIWIHSFYAMAAHPNHGIRTFCFLIDPLCQINGLHSIFEDRDRAFALIQQEVRSQLLAREGDYTLEEDWVNEGTQSWEHLQFFCFDKNGIEVHFPPYQVAPYAAGPQSVEIAYERCAAEIIPLFRSALNIEYLVREENFAS